MRVNELAKTLSTTSTEVLRLAKELGLEASSPLARLDDGDIQKIKSHFQPRSKEEMDREAAERAARLKEKKEKALGQREATIKNEHDSLATNLVRAREIERTVKGVVEPPPAEPVVADAPSVPVVSATPPASEPAAKAPAAAPAPAAPVAAKTEKKPAAAAASPTKPAAAPVAAAASKPRADKPRTKGPRRPATEEETDPDEVLVAAYVPQALKPTGRGGDKARPVRGSEQEFVRGRPTLAPPRRPPVPMSGGRGIAPAPAPAAAAPGVASERILFVRGAVLVKDLAEMLGLRPNRLIADLMQLNVLASINQRVEVEMASRIASKYGYTVELERAKRSTERKPVLKRDDADDAIPDDQPETLVPRPPVVTFLGHVDHGKTSLMDRIRNATVAAGESGGITQHIGAYTVDVNGRKITFLDTPGHAAFSAMRARGASLTDVAVIIIAGDDGVMPQTKEAIRHAKQAGVQILVAINKCDLPQSKPERVKQQLQAEGLTPEDWGGDIVCCEVSATTGKGVNHLLEMILLQADVLELSANPSRRANGYVIEGQLEQGRGPTATLLVTGGTLNVGDVILCGDFFGRIRALVDDRGRMVKSATPGTAVKCMGLSGVPEAGSPFRVMLNEKRARDLAEKFADERKQAELSIPKVASSLDALLIQMKAQGRLELNIIVITDAQGSTEAIVESLKEIKSEKVTLNIINSHIGNINANDVQRAAAGNSIIIGFHVACESGVQSMARHDGVRIHTFRIIYELLDYVKQEMLNLLAPEYRENVRGHAMVKAIFDITRKGRIAGCVVVDGVVRADCKIRIYRQKQVVFNGKLNTLRHFQNEVAEVRDQQECGLRFENFEDFAEGDYIECYALEELPRTL
jgi:translation initiation factor IF-2